jgi:hypothetical protein
VRTDRYDAGEGAVKRAAGAPRELAADET